MIFLTKGDKYVDTYRCNPAGGATLGSEKTEWGYPITINQSNVTIQPASFNPANVKSNYTLVIPEGNSCSIPSGANITCAEGFEIEVNGNLLFDGSSSSIVMTGYGEAVTFDSTSERPPTPSSSLIKIKSNNAVLDIDSVYFENYPCVIRTYNDATPSSISISNSTFDECNIGISLSKIADLELLINKTHFKNSHNGIVFDKQMYDGEQESTIEISFCTFSNIEDYGIFHFQEINSSSNSLTNIYTNNLTIYNVGKMFYCGKNTAVSPSGDLYIFSNNNIFSNTNCLYGIGFEPDTFLVESHNLFNNTTGSTYFDASDDIFQSPLFTDASNGDYSLQLPSPAIDHGCFILGVIGDDYELDLDGTLPDMGTLPYSFPGLSGTRNGVLIIDKDTTIASGYTCILEAGSILRFDAGCELIVNGDLIANNVTFKPNTTTTSLTYWDGIRGISTSDIDLRNCTIKNADRGVETYNGKAYIDNCTIDSCEYGVYLSGLTTGSAVRNCDFNYNDDGAKILYNTSYLYLYNNTFENNDGWAVYLYQSNTHMYSNTINDNEDGVYSWRSNGTYSENIITNSNDDGIAFLQYASVDMNMEWDCEKDKPTNNVITGHGDDGIIVTSSAAPDLGTAQTIIPEEIQMAGFNTIDNNTGLDVYRTSTGAYVNAQGNDWGSSYSISSGVDNDPDKESMDQFEFYKKSADAVELTSYYNPIDEGYKLEGDSLFVNAIAFYENYIENNSDDHAAVQAVVRLAGCYFKLDTPLNDMITELDDLHKTYENTKAGNTAKHYLAGLYVCQGKNIEALQCNSEMINTFVENNDAEMAANAYMDGVIFCETIPIAEGSSLSKSTLQNNKETYITTLLENYPNSEAAKMIAKMYDLQMPASAIPSEYMLYECYPNPFNPETTIGFDLPKSGDVIIDIYNIKGQLVKTVVREQFRAGHYDISFNASNLGSGIYIYKLTSGDYTAVNKMTLLK